MSEIESEIYAALLGEKKVRIIKFLVRNLDEDGFIDIKISQICQELNVSKPTVIETFKLLENKKIFTRIKNGLYQLKI